MKYILVLILWCMGVVVGIGISAYTRRNTQVYSFNQVLMLTDQSDTLINQQADLLLNELTDVAVVRVGLIYGAGIVDKKNYRDFNFDVVNLRAAKGTSPGAMVVGQPLSQWGNIPNSFIDSNCVSSLVVDLLSPEAKTRMAALKATSFVGCPIKNHRGDLLGGVFAIWNKSGYTNDPKTETDLRNAAKKIYDALEIRIAPQDRH